MTSQRAPRHSPSAGSTCSSVSSPPGWSCAWLLVAGASDLTVPFPVLVYSVIAFIVIPLTLGAVTRAVLLRSHGVEWFERRFVAKFKPVVVVALLAMLVLFFAFQADNLARSGFMRC